MTAMPAFEEGQRIEDGEQCKGTVRYVGTVATSKDPAMLYYGIEWDEYGRGKNDGSVVDGQGTFHRYFDGPPAKSINKTLQYKCSFVKVSTMDSIATSTRTTLMDQLRQRYSKGESGNTSKNSIPLKEGDVESTGQVGTTLGSTRTIEFVGAKKLQSQQNLGTVERITLSSSHIASIGLSSPKELQDLVPQLSEIDLSSNLFSDWREISTLLSELPHLDTLVLSDTRFPQGLVNTTYPTAVYPNLKVLVLHKTQLDLVDVVQMINHHFPHLEELHFAGNDVSNDKLQTAFASNLGEWQHSLRVLDLSDNCLCDWDVVESTVGTLFSRLVQLVVNNNDIKALSGQVDRKVFPSLQSLSISDNQIESWRSIDHLNSYPHLVSLRFMRNKLVHGMSAGESRLLLIARVAHLQTVNGGDVRSRERQDSEQLYLKRVLAELAVNADNNSDDDHMQMLHPRLKELMDKYPHIRIHTDGGSDGPEKLSKSLVRVQLVPVAAVAAGCDPIDKRIPEKMTISQVKHLAGKKWRVDAEKLHLSLQVDTKSMPLPMDDDNAEIGWYGLQDGAKVLVNDS